MSQHVNTIRWGDQAQLRGTAGNAVITRELIRAQLPSPRVWRVVGVAVLPNPGNALVQVRLNLFCAMGSTSFGPFPQNVQTNQFFGFDWVGDTISARFETDTLAVDDSCLFAVFAAPIIPHDL